jgi:hypothetical protein
MKKPGKGKKAINKKYTPKAATKHAKGGGHRVGGNRVSRGEPIRYGGK